MPVVGRRAHQFVIGRRRLQLARSHVDPDHPAAFERGIGRDRYFRFEQRVRRFRRHVDAVAVLVEFPAVVDAAQSALFVAAEEQRGAAMRTKRIDDADVAVRIAKRYQIFAQQTHAHRRAVGFGQLFGKQRREPVAAEQVPHRRARTDTGEAFVILLTQHSAAPNFPVIASRNRWVGGSAMPHASE